MERGEKTDDLKTTLLGAEIFCCAKQQFEVTNKVIIKRRIDHKFIRKDITKTRPTHLIEPYSENAKIADLLFLHCQGRRPKALFLLDSNLGSPLLQTYLLPYAQQEYGPV